MFVYTITNYVREGAPTVVGVAYDHNSAAIMAQVHYNQHYHTEGKLFPQDFKPNTPATYPTTARQMSQRCDINGVTYDIWESEIFGTEPQIIGRYKSE